MTSRSATGQLSVQVPDIVTAFTEAVEARQNKTAVTFLGNGKAISEQLSYAELMDRAAAIGCGASEVAPAGSRVPLLMRSSENYIAALFGLMAAGLVPVPLFPPRGDRQIERITGILANCQPAFLLIENGQDDRVQNALPTALQVVPRYSVETLTSMGGNGRLADLKRCKPLTSDLAIIQYTSGSTRSPKGVAIDHDVALANIRCIFSRYEFTENGLTIDWLPPYHDMGLFGCILTPLLRGGGIVKMPPEAFVARPWRWLEAISDFGAYRQVYAGGPNFAYESCLSQVSDVQMENLDLSPWFVAYNGAEPVRARTLKRFASRFRRVGFDGRAWFPCYGMAEATLMISGPSPRAAPPAYPVSRSRLTVGHVEPVRSDDAAAEWVVPCGRVIDGHQLIIVDPNTCEHLPDGRVGEIWFSGDSVARSYFGNPQATRETLKAQTADGTGPYLRTGDLGFLRDGYIHVTGRMSDLIIIDGQNHHPNDVEGDVEETLSGHPIYKVAVFAVEPAESRCEIIAVIEWGRTERESIPGAIRSVRKLVFERRGIPIDRLLIVERGAIPLTSSGKVRRADTRQLYLKDQLKPVWNDPKSSERQLTI
ncbi:fatty acyl-AMP ligase [Cognatiyoonia sp. IB215182]|uniref:fatty acyl-AMP ligase n=1 Tax=Cognatiyoonia sp. IB215182 TaxID=3097353 RepID=UPI002A0C38E0|nr:fatty acyl-AMP ligase [Cognatiyoonia sp. IB215182]MDX8355331.1 fatty acyl-AMP ligase [Cognatiyoonia sp. IB215182]